MVFRHIKVSEELSAEQYLGSENVKSPSDLFSEHESAQEGHNLLSVLCTLVWPKHGPETRNI